MDTRERVDQLTELVRTGKAEEAFHTFYAPDVVMQENNEPPRTSLQASVDRQTQATAGVTVNEFAPRTIVVEGDHAAIAWVIDVTAPTGRTCISRNWPSRPGKTARSSTSVSSMTRPSSFRSLKRKPA